MMFSLSLQRAWRFLAGVFLVALLGACASPARIQESASQTVLERTGRFAASVSYADGRQEAVQGGFAWNDTGRRLLLDLANPMGSVLARVTVQPGRAELERADGATETAPGPDALIEQVLGSPIPVSGLRYWLRGELAAGAPVDGVERDSQGRLSAFTQGGWNVQLPRYDSIGPLLLRLSRHETGRSISVRLVVDAS